MKKFTKFLAGASLGVMLLAGGVALTACNEGKPDTKPAVELSSTLKADAATEVNNLITNVYKNSGSLTKTTYDLDALLEEDAIPATVKYYVKVGTLKNFEEDPETVRLGEQSFKTTDTIRLSIGNGHFLTDVVWKLVDEDESKNLYVSAPVLVFELTQNNKITVGDVEVDVPDAQVIENTKFESVESSNNETNPVSTVQDHDDQYNYNITEATGELWFKYGDAKAEDVLLTKKAYSLEEDNEISYGLTSSDLRNSNTLLAMDFTSNHTLSELKQRFDGAKFDYQAYVVGGKVYHAQVNMTVTAPELELDDSIKANAITEINNLIENVYKKSKSLTQETYDLASLLQDAAISESAVKYYVKVGTLKNFKETPTEITIGTQKFTNDEESYPDLSIGNGHYLQDKVWKIEQENQLYVSAPILMFELVHGNTITIGDLTVTIPDAQTVGTNNITRVESSVSGNTVVPAEEKYTYTINKKEGELRFFYEGAKAGDVLLTKKQEEGKTAGYGFTTVDVASNEYYLGLNLTSAYNDLSALQERFDGVELNYSVYVLGGNIFNATVNISVNAGE